ncbi:MAG: sodium-dependent bicarbonate transport family permease [Planctomycetota bacterium]|nr:MAG: sodium-dependent bicarbonate transport family permease [Planctomycetota bacterium]
MSSLDPVALFFLLGFLAGLLRSELRLPPAIYEFLSIVLLVAIGLKGGVELAKQNLLTLLPEVLAVMSLGVVLPLIAYPLLKAFGKFKRADAASVAAHYGSVSVGTYAVAVAYLQQHGVSFESHAPLYVVLLELPAIVVGIVMARGFSRETNWGKLSHEVLLGGSIVLLGGGFLIAWIVGPKAVEPLEPFFFKLFPGFLALFLLEMGLIAASQAAGLRRYGVFLLLFGILMPLLGATISGLLGLGLGLSVGGTMLLSTLGASASYIAVPAAMRLAVPEANPGLSLGASLGITFPFNVVVGVPMYLSWAQWLHS